MKSDFAKIEEMGRATSELSTPERFRVFADAIKVSDWLRADGFGTWFWRLSPL